ncbi:hypothetical protein GCM10023192_27160 [Amycolatopsis samaneae]
MWRQDTELGQPLQPRLPCSAHHRLIQHTDRSIRIAEDGLPEFLPPDYVDPLRRPGRNILHRSVPDR